jgi:hypothetical protein
MSRFCLLPTRRICTNSKTAKFEVALVHHLASRIDLLQLVASRQTITEMASGIEATGNVAAPIIAEMSRKIARPGIYGIATKVLLPTMGKATLEIIGLSFEEIMISVKALHKGALQRPSVYYRLSQIDYMFHTSSNPTRLLCLSCLK